MLSVRKGLTKEKVAENNSIVEDTKKYQLQKLEEMKQKLPKFINTRKKAFALEYKEYIQEHSLEGKPFEEQGKIPMFKLIQHTFRPLIKCAGCSPAYSADELSIAFDFYKNCTETLNESGVYIPKIEDFCSLINISKSTFNQYQTNSTDQEMREVCNKIQDYCVARLADSAFLGATDKVYSIFHQKASNKQRDNDPIVNATYVQNNTIMTDEQYRELASKFLNESVENS